MWDAFACSPVCSVPKVAQFQAREYSVGTDGDAVPQELLEGLLREELQQSGRQARSRIFGSRIVGVQQANLLICITAAGSRGHLLAITSIRDGAAANATARLHECAGCPIYQLVLGAEVAKSHQGPSSQTHRLAVRHALGITLFLVSSQDTAEQMQPPEEDAAAQTVLYPVWRISSGGNVADAAWNPYLPSEILYVCTNSALHSFRLQDIQETQGPDAASAAAINGSLAAEVVAPAAWHNAQNGRQQMSIAVAGNARRVALAWGQDLLVTQASFGSAAAPGSWRCVFKLDDKEAFVAIASRPCRNADTSAANLPALLRHTQQQILAACTTSRLLIFNVADASHVLLAAPLSPMVATPAALQLHLHAHLGAAQRDDADVASSSKRAAHNGSAPGVCIGLLAVGCRTTGQTFLQPFAVHPPAHGLQVSSVSVQAANKSIGAAGPSLLAPTAAKSKSGKRSKTKQTCLKAVGLGLQIPGSCHDSPAAASNIPWVLAGSTAAAWLGRGQVVSAPLYDLATHQPAKLEQMLEAEHKPSEHAKALAMLRHCIENIGVCVMLLDAGDGAADSESQGSSEDGDACKLADNVLHAWACGHDGGCADALMQRAPAVMIARGTFQGSPLLQQYTWSSKASGAADHTWQDLHICQARKAQMQDEEQQLREPAQAPKSWGAPPATCLQQVQQWSELWQPHLKASSADSAITWRVSATDIRSATGSKTDAGRHGSDLLRLHSPFRHSSLPDDAPMQACEHRQQAVRCVLEELKTCASVREVWAAALVMLAADASKHSSSCNRWLPCADARNCPACAFAGTAKAKPNPQYDTTAIEAKVAEAAAAAKAARLRATTTRSPWFLSQPEPVEGLEGNVMAGAINVTATRVTLSAASAPQAAHKLLLPCAGKVYASAGKSNGAGKVPAPTEHTGSDPDVLPAGAAEPNGATGGVLAATAETGNNGEPAISFADGQNANTGDTTLGQGTALQHVLAVLRAWQPAAPFVLQRIGVPCQVPTPTLEASGWIHRQHAGLPCNVASDGDGDGDGDASLHAGAGCSDYAWIVVPVQHAEHSDVGVDVGHNKRLKFDVRSEKVNAPSSAVQKKLDDLLDLW